jgi:hypothetical protein
MVTTFGSYTRRDHATGTPRNETSAIEENRATRHGRVSMNDGVFRESDVDENRRGPRPRLTCGSVLAQISGMAFSLAFNADASHVSDAHWSARISAVRRQCHDHVR